MDFRTANDPHQGHHIEARNQGVPEGLACLGIQPRSPTCGNHTEEDDEDETLGNVHGLRRFSQSRRCTLDMVASNLLRFNNLPVNTAIQAVGT